MCDFHSLLLYYRKDTSFQVVQNVNITEPTNYSQVLTNVIQYKLCSITSLTQHLMCSGKNIDINFKIACKYSLSFKAFSGDLPDITQGPLHLFFPNK